MLVKYFYFRKDSKCYIFKIVKTDQTYYVSTFFVVVCMFNNTTSNVNLTLNFLIHYEYFDRCTRTKFWFLLNCDFLQKFLIEQSYQNYFNVNILLLQILNLIKNFNIVQDHISVNRDNNGKTVKGKKKQGTTGSLLLYPSTNLIR